MANERHEIQCDGCGKWCSMPRAYEGCVQPDGWLQLSAFNGTTNLATDDVEFHSRECLLDWLATDVGRRRSAMPPEAPRALSLDEAAEMAKAALLHAEDARKRYAELECRNCSGRGWTNAGFDRPPDEINYCSCLAGRELRRRNA